MCAVRLRAGAKGCPGIRAELWFQGPQVQHRGRLLFWSGQDWNSLYSLTHTGVQTPKLEVLCVPLLVSAGRYSVAAETKLFSLYSSDINECALSCKALLFLSLLIPLNKARLYQIAYLYFHHPCEKECVCKEHCDKDKLLSLSLPAPEVQVGKSLMQTLSYRSWGTAASPKENLEISWKLNELLSLATLGSTIAIVNYLKYMKKAQLLLANLNSFIH